MNIFITGATGFLGFHIVVKCVEQGHRVLCLRRKESVGKFSKRVEAKLHWVDKDESCWKETIAHFQPDVLIHCAWEGFLQIREMISVYNIIIFNSLWTCLLFISTSKL